MEPYYLASGEYCFDLATSHTNVTYDHRVHNALRFLVERCSPDGIPFDFGQDRGLGALAMRLAKPVEFAEVPPTAADSKFEPP
jgi:hypothetical protein